uniref:Proteic killer suppression protein n=1 Tax=Candidatus Kentrum sp. FW TaxID=2126338 RepID=A0A450TT55_9GAMM|nr:MAG: proteic killer suppression protein [Candidatus Kentron sp. FW]
MVIYFKIKKLQKICSTQKEMQKKYGARISRKLMQRLMELQAAESLKEISHLPPPRCHALSEDRAGQFSIDLIHPYRLLFIPIMNSIPVVEGKDMDRGKISEIAIIEIADTHE